MTRAITLHRPGLLGGRVFDNVFDNFFNDSFPNLLRQTTQGYPVTDIFRNENGDTVMQLALAGFTRDNLSIEVKPEKRSLTVRASTGAETDDELDRRIARRSFEKTYVNYDDNLDLSSISASFENGLLTVVVPTRPEVKPIAVEIK